MGFAGGSGDESGEVFGLRPGQPRGGVLAGAGGSGVHWRVFVAVICVKIAVITAVVTVAGGVFCRRQIIARANFASP